VRDKNGEVFDNFILAGENGLILRLKDDSAFATGALLAAYGIENNTGKTGGLHEVCAGVD